YVWSHRAGLLLLAAIGVLVGFVCGLTGSRSYTATSQVLLVSPVASARDKPRYELSAASYLELARSADLLSRAVEGAGQGLSEDARRPGGVRLEVTRVPDTRILRFNIQASTAHDSAVVANEAARLFIERCQDLRLQEIQNQRHLIGLD